MTTKITSDHLCRAAVVYVRQSTMNQATAIWKVSAGSMIWPELQQRPASHRLA